MNITEIKKIAQLARIEINISDTEHYTNELSHILHLGDQMNAVETSAVEPLAHPLEIKQRLRADEVTATNQRDYLQHCAPAIEAGLYLVPKVLDEA